MEACIHDRDGPGCVSHRAPRLRRVLERLGEGERALVVGHSPTNEAAVLGLTGKLVAPLAKGAGVLVVADGERFRVEPLDA